MWQRVTREQLYEQVWSVPIWTLCEQYGLSDNGLRRVCKRLNVPVPERGERGGFHWLTECQAVRANAGTLTCRPVLSGAGTAQRNG